MVPGNEFEAGKGAARAGHDVAVAGIAGHSTSHQASQVLHTACLRLAIGSDVLTVQLNTQINREVSASEHIHMHIKHGTTLALYQGCIRVPHTCEARIIFLQTQVRPSSIPRNLTAGLSMAATRMSPAIAAPDNAAHAAMGEALMVDRVTADAP